MITFDANILFYVYDMDAGEKQQRCFDVLKAAEHATGAFITLQALGEFACASTRRGMLPRDRALAAVRDWSSVFELRTLDKDAWSLALDWWADQRLSYWDAMLVATASKAGARALVSEDLKDGAVFGGVEVVNPFAADAFGRLAGHGLRADPG